MTPELQQLLERLLSKLDSVERELALQREDTRLIRQELREQHSILVGLLGHTPPTGIRAVEAG